MSAYLHTSRLLFESDERASLGTGTGFMLNHHGKAILATNWHVLTGREPLTDEPTGECSAKPDHVVANVLIQASVPGMVASAQIPLDLYDEHGKSLWWVHPQKGRAYDVALLPIKAPSDAVFFGYSANEPDDPATLSVTSDVSIVGYPYDLGERMPFAVWTRGTIATDPETDFESDPCFLVDARARPGQSGSPVILHWMPHKPKTARHKLSPAASDPETELLGIYSGRINDQSDLGRVWRRSVIREILAGETRDDYTWD